MSTAHVKGLLLWWETEDVNSPWWVFLQRQRFHNKIVTSLRTRDRQLDIYKLVNFWIACLEQIGISLLAYLALEGLPVHADEILSLLSLQLGGEPVAQAIKVYESYTAFALARHYARILLSRLVAPAEPACQLILWVLFLLIFLRPTTCLLILQSDARLSLFELLLIQLFSGLSHVLALEVLDSKFDAAQLDHIELPDLVVLSRDIIKWMSTLTYFP